MNFITVLQKHGPPQRPEIPSVSINEPTKADRMKKKWARLQEEKPLASASRSGQFAALNAMPSITLTSPKKIQKIQKSRIPSIELKQHKAVTDKSVQLITSQKIKGKVCNAVSSFSLNTPTLTSHKNTLNSRILGASIEVKGLEAATDDDESAQLITSQKLKEKVHNTLSLLNTTINANYPNWTGKRGLRFRGNSIMNVVVR